MGYPTHTLFSEPHPFTLHLRMKYLSNFFRQDLITKQDRCKQKQDENEKELQNWKHQLSNYWNYVSAVEREMGDIDDKIYTVNCS